ncbi:GNAT family N-acetyltransferase [Hymenobacter sp. DH14]|uniref:GNAT family N-acetyltransferase n=1 Tax=Hymenobacter cyanobacteriorum TaxID=2926463 RepID=A0A9X2AFW6_9BACT|nr:GNAT family N-acetyltransferase [Hymenobacter cyanobacteriorum]MCI1188257.1 GNAT family N-acetyltransferase [Hymenobacter cyanobacteriorum]
MTIHPMEARHWPQVRAIYEAGMATGNATFATQVARGQGWNKAHLSHSRLVALHPSGRVLGWAALSPVSEQSHLPGVAQIQVYVATTAQTQGVGRALLAALVAASEAHGIWTLHAVVFPENQAIQCLCQSVGFRVVGQHQRIGQLHGIWRDVLVLERRSAVVGTADSSQLPQSRARPASGAPHSARNPMGSVTLTHTG